MEITRIRRPRHARVPFEGYQLTPRDLDILKQLRRYRVLSTKQLATIFETETVVKNLRALFHNGYIDKPQAGKFFRNSSTIYALSDTGERVLIELGYPRGMRDRSHQNHALKPWSLPHLLLIADILVSLERAAKKRTDLSLMHLDELIPELFVSAAPRIEPVRLETEIDEGQGRHRPTSVIPDAAVVLVHHVQPEQLIRLKLLFIEADSSTEPVTRSDPALASIERKLTTYRAYGREKGSTVQFGINNFRTLFATSGSSERVHSFAATEEKLTNGRGSSRFLFATRKELEDADFLSRPLLNGAGDRVALT